MQGETRYSAIVRLKSMDQASTISVYPNPVQNNFVINGYAGNSSLLVANVFDASGKLRHSEKWTQLQGSYAKNISAVNLSAGVYYVTVTDRDQTMEARFVKQ